MVKKNNQRDKERTLAAELISKLINSGVCDTHLSTITKIAKEYATPTMTWEQGCEVLNVGKSKFFELYNLGIIHKVDRNAYTTESILKYKEEQ